MTFICLFTEKVIPSLFSSMISGCFFAFEAQIILITLKMTKIGATNNKMTDLWLNKSAWLRLIKRIRSAPITQLTVK